METNKNNNENNVYKTYFRIMVEGTMPSEARAELDAWTLSRERPRGTHVEYGTTVEYSYWLTHDEVVKKYASEIFYNESFREKLTALSIEPMNFIDSLKDDDSYNNLYFRIIENGEYRALDGVLNSTVRPEDDDCPYDDECRETYKTLREVMEQYSELLPMAISMHDDYFNK